MVNKGIVDKRCISINSLKKINHQCGCKCQIHGERIIFLTNFSVIVTYLCAKMNIDSYFVPHIIINSKWITYLKVKSETIKVLEENTGENFCGLALGKELSRYHKSIIHKRKKLINWTSKQTNKKFYSLKDAITKTSHWLALQNTYL